MNTAQTAAITDAEYLEIANEEKAANVAFREVAHRTGESGPEFFAAYRRLTSARAARAEAQRALGAKFVTLTGPSGP